MSKARKTAAALFALLTVRALLALGLSSAVTAGIAGPLAIQTLEVREATQRVAEFNVPQAAAPSTTAPPTTPTTAPPTSPAPTTLPAPTTSTGTTAPPPSTTVPDTTAPPSTSATTISPPPTSAPIVAVPTLPPPAPGPEPEPTARGLWVQVDPERAANRRVRLDNLVRGSVYVTFEDGQTPISSVSFWLDGDGSGTPTGTDFAAPFDLFPDGGGVRPLDTTGLSNGPHELLAVIRFADGRTDVRTTSFRVDNTNP